jgi:hypothetical protein
MGGNREFFLNHIARLGFLPPDLPDFKPIEQVFADQA